MKSQVIISDHPPTIKVYEQPEPRDALSWIIMIILFLIVILGIFIFTNPDLILPALLVIVVIILPFFVNRFLTKRGTVGGESFKLQKFADNTVIYRNREFDLEQITFEFIDRKLQHGRSFLLFMINNTEEIKLRSDYGMNKQDTTTYHIAKHIEEHLGIEVKHISE